MTARNQAELEHAIIEQAKESHRQDPAIAFVRHLEDAAEEHCGGRWGFETLVERGVWRLRTWPIGQQALGQGELL
jgi:hypothetical protein